MADIDNVDVAALARAAQDPTRQGRPTILDVREDYEWQAGHIEGALHVPLDQLPNRLDELDPDEDLHVICRTGGRSFRATNWLVENGYSAVNVAGGMGAWLDADLPMVSETGEPPRVL
jgi:rhodanese-related sulfurtransferase